MFKDYLKLHIIILVLAFTGLLGDLIKVPAYDLVWYRTLFGSIGLLIWILFVNKKQQESSSILDKEITQKHILRINQKDVLIYLGIGTVIGLHWFCFFHSIDVSNISVGVGCLSSTALFTSFLDPIFFKRKLNALELVVSIIIIIGLYTIFQFETKYTEGILYASASAFFAALFTVLNKKYTSQSDNRNVVITFYEILGAWLCMGIVLTLVGRYGVWTFQMEEGDLFWLLILGIVCTSYTFVANIELLKRLSAFVMVLSFNLEPIYGMLIGAFRGEEMTNGFYLGASIILIAVFSYPLVSRRLKSLKRLG